MWGSQVFTTTPSSVFIFEIASPSLKLALDLNSSFLSPPSARNTGTDHNMQLWSRSPNIPEENPAAQAPRLGTPKSGGVKDVSLEGLHGRSPSCTRDFKTVPIITSWHFRKILRVLGTCFILKQPR